MILSYHKMSNIKFRKKIIFASPTSGLVLHLVVTQSVTFQKRSGPKMAADLRCVRQRDSHFCCGPLQLGL